MDNKFDKLGDLLLKRNTVNSNLINNSIDTVNSNNALADKISDFIKEQSIKPEGVASIISELLDDKKSFNYYLLLVKEHNNGILLDLAYQTKERAELGQIKTRKPFYFMGILRRKGFKTKFR